MKILLNLPTISLFLIIGTIFIVQGCDNNSKQETALFHWPPTQLNTNDSLNTLLSSDLEQIQFCMTGTVYDDASLKSAGGGDRRWGQIACQGELELSYNIFAIKNAGDGYTLNSFEVLYFDNDRTRLKINEEKNDKLMFEVDTHTPYRPGQMSLKMTVTMPGTKVRYADRIYEIRKDGWHVDGELVHAFAENLEKNRAFCAVANSDSPSARLIGYTDKPRVPIYEVKLPGVYVQNDTTIVIKNIVSNQKEIILSIKSNKDGLISATDCLKFLDGLYETQLLELSPPTEEGNWKIKEGKQASPSELYHVLKELLNLK
ncbi:MAG: hypothetical protein R2824_29630 [Saprospiraceae bacterium]